jgi:hypothetical protein
MYLAAILGLCALTNCSVATIRSPAELLALMQESQPQPDVPPTDSPQPSVPQTQPAVPAQEAPPTGQESGSQKAGSEKARSEKAGSEKAGSKQAGSEKVGPPPPTPQVKPAPDTAQPPRKTPSEPSANRPAAKPPATSARKRRRRKRAVATSKSAPEKKVVRNGGATDPVVQLSPGVSDEEASRQRQSTTQLLATTDANLKQLAAHPLNPTQQDSVSQVRKYMEQAKAAEEAGDVQRAQNLASKALMLSDDLVKH